MKHSEQGFGTGEDFAKNRLINQNGNFNIERKGAISGVRDFYSYLISISWSKYIFLTFSFYIVINLLYASIYYALGEEAISHTNKEISYFMNCFYFSIQTFTSLGYGALSPGTNFANIVVTFESFSGIIGIALTTGLLYGRFSKPSSKIIFSDKALFTRVDDTPAIMFKVVNSRKSVLLNAKSKMILSIQGDKENSNEKNYHILKLQISTIPFFPLTWNIVHLIDDDSPIKDIDFNQFKSRSPELICTIEAFDETHSQSIIAIKSYANDQWLANKKFKKSFYKNNQGTTILDINSINDLVELD